jgi:outer membrane receptor protein involved in Fe transport
MRFIVLINFMLKITRKTEMKSFIIKNIMLILFLISTSEQIFSQDKTGTITGSVIDRSTNKPIEYADVSLISEKDSAVIKGTSTDSEGKFTMNGLPYGRYFIRASIVGYNFAVVTGLNININNPDIALEPIVLLQSTATTEEIVVEGEKSIIELKPDKKVFNVTKNLTARGGTLLDLLKEIPSVVVDQDGNISMRGSDGVKITIDGKQSGLEGQGRNLILEQVPANEVESIELITNPSAKYEAEGTVGIINIKLKKNKQEAFGYNGNLGLNVGTGDKYSGQFGFSVKNKKVNLFGNYSYDLRNLTTSGFYDRDYYSNPALSSSLQNDSGKIRGKSHLLKLGMDYNIDNNNYVGLTFNYRNLDRTTGNTSLSKEYNGSGILSSDYLTTAVGFNKGYNLDLSTGYIHNFEKKNHVISAEISYSKDKDDKSEKFSDAYIFPVNNTPDKRNEYSIELNDAVSGKIDYVYPFSKNIKIEAGYRGSYIKRDIDFMVENYNYNLNQFETDYNQSNKYIYKEQIHALYGIFTQQIGGFGYSLGIRSEQTTTTGELQTNGERFDRNYVDFFPSASISQKLDKTSEVQLSYSRRIRRPKEKALNPFRTYMGSNSYHQGNQNLNPEYSDSYEINFIKYFSWATLTPGIFYRYSKDGISPQRKLIDSINTLTMPVNMNNSVTYGGELIVNFQPVKFFSFNGTFNYFKTEVDAANLQSGLTNRSYSWSSRSLASLTLPSGFIVQMSYFYMGKRVTAQGTMDPFQSFDAGIKKDLFDKSLSISLRVSDIFNNSNFRVQFTDPDFYEEFERRRDSRTLMLNITYNFGQKDNKQNKGKKNNGDEKDNGDNGFGY